MSYPVSFDLDRPPRFARVQVALRLAVIVALAVIGLPAGFIGTALYLLLPIVAAVLISQKGATRYLEDDGPWILRVLTWLLAFQAYVGLLTEEFPTKNPERLVRFTVPASGNPTMGEALLRLVLTIPHALVLALLGIVAGIVWLISMVLVLLHEEYPPAFHTFLLRVLRWQARVIAWHASLVDVYPPFSLEEGSGFVDV